MGHTHTDFQGFTYRTLVYIGDATPFGQAYFARYFEWQGRAREEFLAYLVPTAEAILERFRILTAEASVRYQRELLLHEPVAIEIRIEELTRASVVLRFTYRHAERRDVVAEGRQRIVFTDQAGRIMPLPNDVRHRALAYRHAHDGP
ncbi:MAG: thioesterase family protein [Candidatus Omnitrophota bacterium]|nr:thioesterase family protein [Candidatus Omnitrophota bacterium]